MINNISYISFSNPFNPFMFCGILLALLLFTWYFTRGIRHRLVRRNFLIIYALYTLLFILLLFLISEPVMQFITLKNQKGRLIVLFDGSASTRLRNDTPWKLMYQADNPVKKNCSNYLPEYHIFSEDEKRLDENDINIPVMPEGTDIFSNIEAVLKDSDPADDIKILLFSDGRDSIPPERLDILKLRGVPVYTVGLGEQGNDSLKFKDVNVNEMQVPDNALVFNETVITGRIIVRGYENETLSITLSANGELIGKNTLELIRGKTLYETSFSWRPTTTGKVELSLSASRLPGEKDENNNSIAKKINIITKSNRVLFVQGKISWEYSFLKNELHKAGDIEMDSLLYAGENRIIADNPALKPGFPVAEELSKYGILVLADCRKDLFSEEQLSNIEKFTSERGGAVIFAGRAMFEGKNPMPKTLEKLLPVTETESNSAANETTFSLIPSDDANSLLFKGFSEELKKLVLPVANLAPCFAKQVATTLLKTRNSPATEQYAGSAFERYGTGRTIYIGFDTSWLWVFKNTEEDLKKFYKKFWRAILLLAIGDITDPEKNNKLLIQTEKPVNMQGESVKIKLTAGPKPDEAAMKSLYINVTDPSGSEFPIPWKFPFGGSNYVYSSFTPKNDGKYVIKAGITINSKIMNDSLVLNIRKDLREFENITLNEALLKRISAATGGQYLSMSQYTQKPFQFRRDLNCYKEISILPVWSGHVLFWLAVLLLGILWILKRSINLC